MSLTRPPIASVAARSLGHPLRAGLTNSDRHTHSPLPTLVVGGGAGTIKGGRHLVYPEGTPLTNLHVTLLDKVGVPVDRLGDSTGKFSEVLG